MGISFREALETARARDEPKAQESAPLCFVIEKKDDDRQMVFGWASVAATPDGKAVLDRQGDYIEIAELEKAVYEYVLTSRSGGEMHERGGVGIMVESIVFTPEKMAALGIKPGILPYGWWIGLKITDAEVWKKIKAGKYKMFSIEGRAKRVPVDEKGG